MTIKQAGIEIHPEFDINEHGSSVAPMTCKDCGEVLAHLSYAIKRGRILYTLECDCGNVLAVDDNGWRTV